MDSVQDAASYFMNDFIKDKLLQQGINTDFTYTLNARDSTEYLASPTSYSKDEILLKYPIVLDGYLQRLINKDPILELQFKNLNKYFLFQLNGLIIPGLLFILAIVFVIIWVLKSFYGQKKLITSTNEFINNLTHELKTPVFSIGLASKILQERSSNENLELVKLIRTQVDKLKNQIEKVLELASLEEKKNFIEKKVIDFKPIILSLSKDFEKLVTLENIDFSSEINNDNYILNCDAYLLESAVNSLLENAKKYTKENVKIKLLVYKENKKLFISVKDNGIGISEEDTKRIFDKYYRVSSGDIHKVKGYGIGLNYVKRIMKLHKGKIIVNSTLGKGSEFIISLPLYKYDK
jgi:two-component system phosphate regulon sensor histidine kinase PhoR